MAGPVIVRTGRTFLTTIEAGNHELQADEPVPAGGTDQGPDPYDLLAAALGSCKAITMRMYADRKEYPLESVEVVVSHGREHVRDCADCLSEEGYIHRFASRITLHGDLTEEQRQRLLQIAGRCPVAKTLSHEIRLDDELV
jgi:uncharacterized OsmC-like protein